jgi:hypothetical protein
MEVNSMKKKLMVLAMTLMLLVSITTPVLADNQDPGPPGWATVPGKGIPGTGK